MAKNSVSDWSTNADSNTDIAGINIDENCPPAGINNAIRTIMAQVAVFAATVLKTGAGVTNDFLGAVAKRVGNASTIYDTSATPVEQPIGYRGIPSNAKSVAYTLAASDNGFDITITTGGVTIPTQTTVAFSDGFASGIYNDSTSSQTITAATGVTIRLAGTTTTGNRALAAYGYAFVKRIRADLWIVGGAGVS